MRSSALRTRANIETLLRQVPERTRDGLWQRIGALLDLLTPEE
jgi:hypothetical protein